MKHLIVAMLLLTSCIVPPKPVGMPVIEPMLLGYSDAIYAGCVRGVVRLYMAANAPADFAFIARHCEETRRTFTAKQHPADDL